MARTSVGQELLDVPFPEMIQSMAMGIAEAQFELDRVGMRLAQMMSGTYDVEVVDPVTGDKTVTQETYTISFAGEELSLLELGFTPTFYQFVDTLIEVKISISITTQTESERTRKVTSASAFGAILPWAAGGALRVSSVSARYASKYQYSAEGSSLLRTKLVPVPSPAILEERIRGLLETPGE